jgi:hypothetical protein
MSGRAEKYDATLLTTVPARHFSVQKNPAKDLADGLRTAPDTGNSHWKTVVQAVASYGA